MKELDSAKLIKELNLNYAPLNHAHNYASSTHNHDTVYSKLNHTHDYLSLSGGTVTADIYYGINIKRNHESNGSSIAFSNTSGQFGGVGFQTDKFVVSSGTNTNGDLMTITSTNVNLGNKSVSALSFSGNASSASTLETARTINGTSFNGSANITTANWGTGRTITIGSTGKSVNGSANVSWTLSEIGAAATSHNHDSAYSASSHNHDSVYSKTSHNHDSVYSKTNHGHNSISTSNGGGIYEGTGDNANSTVTNVQIKSWYGIGFAPSISGQTVPQNQNAVWINTRNGDLTARGTIKSNTLLYTDGYTSTPTLVSDRLQGRAAANRYYTGSGNCRMDTNDGWIRIFTTAVGSSDSGIRVDPNGGVSLLNAGVGKHNFNSDGAKYGGSIEIDGTTYGMSPIDSPQFLIEDILFDQEVEADGTIIKLDNIFSKSINGKYAVFVNNSKAEVIDKGYDNFTIIGYTGIVDIRLVGKRLDHENDYYKIMGGFEHGVETDVIS